MNPQPTKKFLASVYARSGHGLSEPISYPEVLRREEEYPNATVDSERLVSWAINYMGGGRNNQQYAIDIGSGFGFFSRAALQSGFKVKSINPGKWENQVFAEMNGFSPIPAFFEDLDLQGEKFDLVILSQVLEHIEKPYDFLVKIREIIKPGGILAIAVPNVNSIFVKILRDKDNGCLWVPEHLIHFSKLGLKALLSRTGFEIQRHIYLSRIPYFSLSNKLKLTGFKRNAVNFGVKVLQYLPLKICNLTGTGIMHNLWASPKNSQLP